MRLRHSLLLTLLTGCLSSSFEGPAFEDGAELQGPFLAAVTHTKVARGEHSAFGDHVLAIEEQQDHHEGFLGRSLRIKAATRTRWTLTLWQDEESMMRFVTEGAHLEAMAVSGEVIDGVRSAVWTIADDEEFPPTWSDALDVLDEQSPDIPWTD